MASSVAMNLALLTVVMATYMFTTVRADECGTRFTDPTSSTVRAQIVVLGSVMEWNPVLKQERVRSANVSISKVYKGEAILNNIRNGESSVVMVSRFGQEDKNNCVASDTDMSSDQKHIFFLRQSHQRHMLQMSALPVPMETRVEKRVKRSLCDTCVKPPHIKKLVCKDCAKEPMIKDMKPKKVVTGRRARLRCIARGKPQPSFTWTKNGLPITSGTGGVTLRSTGSSSTLIISQTMSAHAGSYKCEASNDIGKTAKTVILELTSKPARKAKLTVETSPDRVPCENNPCSNNAACLYSPSLDLSFCVCPEHYEGVTCENVKSGVLENVVSNTADSGDNVVVEVPDADRSPSAADTQGNSDSHSNYQPDNSVELNNAGAQHHAVTSRQHADSVIETTTPATSSYFRTPKPGKRKKSRLIPGGASVTKSTTTTTVSLFRTPAPVLRKKTTTPAPVIFRKPKKGKRKKSRRISGGANLQVQACEDQDYCLNGGECSYVPATKFKFCKCASGFVGRTCERRI